MLPVLPSLPTVKVNVVFVESIVRLHVTNVQVVFTPSYEHAVMSAPVLEPKRIFELPPVPFQVESVLSQNETVTTCPDVPVIEDFVKDFPVLEGAIRIDAGELRDTLVSTATPVVIATGALLALGSSHTATLCPGAIPSVMLLCTLET